MTTRGIHFAGLDNDETAAVIERLADIAAEMGYTTRRGKLAGRGNIAALMAAIARGEIALRGGEEIESAEDSSLHQ